MGFYLLFFVSALLSLIGSVKGKKIVTIILIIILTLFAGTRLKIDNDYHIYYSFFQYIEENIKDFLGRTVPVEWCIYVFPHFFKIFFTEKLEIVRASFMLFALFGVTTKLIAIKKYSSVFFLSIILYVSNLFIMQEMTTIRAGVAAGIFLLSIGDIEEKKYKNFFFKILLCFFFHSSSVIFIIVWLLLKAKINIKYLYIAIIISFISAISKVNMLTLLFLDKIFLRVEIYIKMMDWMKEDDTNIYNFKILFALGMVVVFGLFYKKLKIIKYFDVLFRIHIISICIFFFLSTSAQVFSLRTFELLSVIQILLYPLIIYVFSPKLRCLGWIIIIAFSILQIVYLIDIADIYKPYESWFFN